MLPIKLVSVFQVDDHVISDITSSIGSILVSDCTNHDQWVGLFTDSNNATVTLDISRTLINYRNVDWTQTLGDFINQAYTTAPTVVQSQITYFPVKDPQSGKFENRIVTFDPIRTLGIHVTYGRIEIPGNVGADHRGVSKDLLFILDSAIITSNPTNWVVFVNGVAHKTVVTQQDGVPAVWVIDGFENVKQARTLNLCVLDTNTIGGHSIVPITANNLVANDANIWTSCHISDPTLQLGNKTTLLCVDGYLHCLDDAYRVVTDTRVQLNIHRMELIPQFIQNPNQRFYTDIFGVGNRVNPLTGENVTLSLDTTPDAKDQYLDSFTVGKTIKPSVLQDPAFVRSRLTSNHSFLIVLNNQNLYRNAWTPITYGDAGNLFEIFSESTPRGIAQYGYGKVVSAVLTSSDMRRHTFYVDQLDTSSDEYLDVLNPDFIASRKCGILNPAEPRRFTLTELYTGALS